LDYTLIAQNALEHYDICVCSLSPIAQSGSAVFKIENNQGQLYNLRIHIPKSLSLGEIWTRQDVLNSEMEWVDALGRDTDLTLPIPQRNRQGMYVTQVNEINCTLLTWVEGEQKQYFSNEHELKSAAVMTAKLHRQASHWQPHAAFVRPVYDGSQVRNGMDMLAQWAQQGLLNADDVQILNTAGEKAIAMLDTLPRNNMTWGILHMDLFPANIVYVNSCANPIDFGSSGFGFYLMDLTNTFCFILPSMREQYIAWYGAHFQLPENYVKQLEGLFIAKTLISMTHWLGLPGASDWLPDDVHKYAAREFGRYLKREDVLFSGTPFWE
jgi:Ser/Thr protein kinase RdoA (MazF antagonist)